MNEVSSDDVLEVLLGREDAASVMLFLDLLKSSPELLHWLEMEFPNPKVQKRLRNYLSGKALPPDIPMGMSFLAWLSHSDLSKNKLVEKLRENFKDVDVHIYGGLSYEELVSAIHGCQKKGASLEAYLMVLLWKGFDRTLPSAKLCLSSAYYLQKAIVHRDSRHLEDLLKAVNAYEDTLNRPEEKMWWKLVLLFYVLDNPKPAYTTREFVAYLKENGINVDKGSILDFSREYGIRKVVAPGRPPKGNTAVSKK